MDILYCYKTMPQFHKDNLNSYLIYNGIFTVSPDISDDDARFIFEVCSKIENENINYFSISHYLTEHFVSRELTKENIKNVTNGEICSAVLMNDLSYFNVQSEEKEEEILK